MSAPILGLSAKESPTTSTGALSGLSPKHSSGVAEHLAADVAVSEATIQEAPRLSSGSPRPLNRFDEIKFFWNHAGIELTGSRAAHFIFIRSAVVTPCCLKLLLYSLKLGLCFWGFGTTRDLQQALIQFGGIRPSDEALGSWNGMRTQQNIWDLASSWMDTLPLGRNSIYGGKKP